MFGTSLTVTSDTRHCAPSLAAPSAVIRSTTNEGGSPGARSAAAGGGGAGACASAATVSETAANNPAGTRAPKVFPNIANPPCVLVVVVIVRHGGWPRQRSEE